MQLYKIYIYTYIINITYTHKIYAYNMYVICIVYMDISIYIYTHNHSITKQKKLGFDLKDKSLVIRGSQAKVGQEPAMGITPTADALRRVPSHPKAKSALTQPAFRSVSPCLDPHVTLHAVSLARVARDSTVNHGASAEQKGGQCVCAHLEVSSEKHIRVSRG